MQIKLQNKHIENKLKAQALDLKTDSELIELINECTLISIYDNNEDGFDKAFSSSFEAVTNVGTHCYTHEYIKKDGMEYYFNSCDLDTYDLISILHENEYKCDCKSWVDYLEDIRHDKSITYNDLPIADPYDLIEVENVLTNVVIDLVNKNDLETVQIIKNDIDKIGALEEHQI